MDAGDIKQMFEGISEASKEVIARKLRAELSAAIIAINNKLTEDGLTRERLSPQPALIMNAFRLCDIKHVRVVVIGQDPYIKPGEAMGMSFSTPRGVKIPPSLKRIYECLLHHGLIKCMPAHGDLSSWAEQGVLLLNTALTTVIGKSNAHSDIWSRYTDALIRELSNLPQSVIFILLGEFAQRKKKLIDLRKHVVLEWGHPSPLNSANKTDNPKNFKYCDAFVRTNDMLIMRGQPPIVWDPDGVAAPVIGLADIPGGEFITGRVVTGPVVAGVKVSTPADAPAHANIITLTREAAAEDPAPLTVGTTWLFTDGGSRGNGKQNCSASWAYYITDGCNVSLGYGIVEEKHIPGEVFRASNNRGELTALLRGLEYIAAADIRSKVMVVSDSEYSINCLDKWADAWFANPAKHKLGEKKNLDLITPAKEALDTIRARTCLDFKHVNSHLQEPRDSESEEWFLWKCNDIVDRLCGKALGR